uniref:MADS-box protein JOINTLESS-like n=1 Tax=Rhizophora mucronata TaxID=61149 RepID=A0A2P2M569_RHIMU
MKLPTGQTHTIEQGHSSGSMMTNNSSSANPAQDCDTSYTFLKLGLVPSISHAKSTALHLTINMNPVLR